MAIFSLGANAQKNQKKAGQTTNWGLGLKFGDPSGITLKNYMGSGNAWDLTVGRSFRSSKRNDYYYGNGGLSATFTYQWRKNLANTSGLEWYYGIGAQVSSRRYYKKYNGYWVTNEYDNKIALGVVGVIGLEYAFSEAPFSLFLEATPYVELAPSTMWIDMQGSLGARFRF